MATDSPVATAYVPAPDHWSRGTATPRAIVIHMAEGGGTVSWLTRLDGNSSHYVVEYSGRVVQMVRESEAAGSMNPKATRGDNDPPYTFDGETIIYGRAALDAAGLSSDPNRYAIAVEVEGFAVYGPNAAQVDALRRLVADIRRRRGHLPVLGHRDQQNYKACPGRRMPWNTIAGGHGVRPQVEERDVKITRVKGQDWQATGRANLFAEPDTSSEKLATYESGDIVRTIAAAGTSDGAAWRLTEASAPTVPGWIRVEAPDGGGPWDEITGPGVSAALSTYIDRTPNPEQEDRSEIRKGALAEAVNAIAAIVP